MNMKIRSFRIIVEKERHKNGFTYVAYVPSLGISDFGKTVDEAVKNIDKAIKLFLETLVELKKPIPDPDSDEYFVTTSKVKILSPTL